MFYQYNNFTGRLVGTGQFKAYNPQGLQQLAKEPPTSVYSATAPASAAHVATSSSAAKPAVATSSSSFYGNVPKRLQQLQAKFQLNYPALVSVLGVIQLLHNNMPVHIKGGGADKALFFFTAALCVIGVANVANFIYGKSFPKKAED